jgi:pimeloyl-ACP methyl ester carboxylesterase
MIFRNSSFKSHVPRPLETVSRPFGWLACALLLVTNVTAAEAPTWWQTRGVLQTNATPNDYAALNVGQLKQIAFSAWQELESLPGGAGFQPTFTNAANNFAAVNIGQLKAVAQPCYNRLIGLGLATNYPWAKSSSTNNYAIANIGQAKNLFSFTFILTLDTDGDGMPDLWEAEYGFDRSVWQTDGIHGPGDDADGDGLVNTQELALATSPISADTDNDGLSDFQEMRLNRLVAWGDNTKNQCTIPSEAINVVGVSAGFNHSLVLRADGTVVAWGDNSYDRCSVPASATNVIRICAGAKSYHSLALRANGTVVAWGFNSHGQTNVPASATNVIAISAGERHSLALRADGRVVAWGFNYYGQTNVPSSATNVIAISAGGYHSLAITREGRIISWGMNNNVPASATNVVTVADGPMHNLALRADGSVIGWGTTCFDMSYNLVTAANSYGQYSIPASVTSVIALAVGEYHSLALRKDGKVIAWGNNDFLQCSGATNLSCVAAISAGLRHNLALIHSNPLKSDSDGDGMTDGWEVSNGFDPLNKQDASQDSDADGLSNLSEFTNKTAPRNADTDNDGMPDGWELTYKLNPLNSEDAMLDFDQDHTLNKREYEMGSDPTAGYFLKETFDSGIPSDWMHGTYNGSWMPTPFDAPKWISTWGSAGLGLEQVLPCPKGNRGLNVGICNVGGRDNNRYGQSSLMSPWINLGQGMTNVILHFYFSNPGFFNYNHYLTSSHDAYKGDQLVVYCRSRTRTAEGQEVFDDREIFNAKNPDFASYYWTSMSIRIPNPSADCQIVFVYGYTYLGLGVYVDEVSITGDYGVIYKDQMPLVIETDSTLPSSKKGMPYSTQLSVRGGLRPFLWHYQWSIVSNTLPQGLALDQNTGIISGTPALPGTWNFAVEAKSDYGKVATNQFTLFVLDPFVALSEKFDSTWLPQGWTQEEQNAQSSWTAVPGISPTGTAGSNVWYKGNGTTSPKLISPVMDLSKCTSNVVLRFYYRNPKSAEGYRDYLIVCSLDGQETTYMGASASINSNGSLGESLPDTDTWKQVVFRLPRLSATTQIAFRGLTGWTGSTPQPGGRIFLDEVEVLADYADPIFLAWIAEHFPDGTRSGFDDDPDQDGLSNLKEYQKNTDPNDNDSDDDGLMDGDEVARGTNPTIKDTDGDGLEDGAEVNTHHTDPLNPDTDGDDLPDSEELIQGTNPMNPDTDSDGISDGWEVRYGYSPLVRNDPSLDQDNDGLTDAQEFSANTNPLKSDTDNDGLSDAEEVRYGFNPNQFAVYVDTDKDGLPDKIEIARGTDPNKWDSDGDCMSDGWEFYGGINPLNATGVDGQLGDPDGDGLSNFDEYINGTSPTKKDTDGDGVSDKVEVEQGSNPLDKSDNGIPPPASELVEIPFTVGDPSGSHSERWQMNIKSLGPTDTRAFYFVNETFGTVGTKNFKLRKGNSYEITLQHQATASGNTTDYDWQAQIGGLPSTSVLESGKTHPTATRYSSRSDLNILIDNEAGLLGVVDQNFETPNHTISKIATLYVVGLDVYPLIHKDLGLVDASAPWYIGVDKVPSPVEELPESKRNIRASDLIIDTKISLPSHYGNITIQATGSAAYVYLYKAYFTPGENPFELILTPENRTATITLFDWFRVFCGRGSMSTDAHIICTNAGVGSIKINYNSTYQQSTPLQVEDEQMFTAVRLGLVPDYDRDGSISETDRTNAVNNRAFRFWVNNDKDIDAREGDDTPGATEPDCADAKVNGLRDLNDWMPLMIDASEVIGTIGMKKYSYWICHEDAAVNILLRPDGTPFSYPDGAHSCNSHIFDPDTAKYLVGGRVAQVTANGIEVTSQISEAINGKATVLLEGRGLTRGSDNCLTLEIRSKTDGSIAYKYRFMLSLDTVTSMYRQLNTRSLCGGEGGMSTQTNQPLNLPDDETEHKHIVYVHGYNMNGSDAVGEQSAVFKNLWWCGSNARFHAVSWYGDATQILALGKTPNFYTNTANAFLTAPYVSTYIQSLAEDGEVTVIAHSLGNMVASAAISLYHAPAANYFMLDAAVAQEAYNEMEPKTPNMVNANWSWLTTNGFPNVLFASEWHSLFPVTDARRKLTMRGLFTNMVNTSVCNFYSSGEDVVGNAPYGYADDWSDSSISGLDAISYAWCAQEKNKGRIPRKADLISAPFWWGSWSDALMATTWPTVGTVETYANDWLTAFLNEAYPFKDGGWMINKANLSSSYSMPMDWLGVACYRRKTLTEMLDPVLTGEAIWTLRPLFTLPAPLTDINDTTASSYAETNRFFLLSHVFPATTYGMGSNPTGSAAIDNWNMNDLENSIKHGWWNPDKLWTHSDFKNMALLYTQEVYKEMIMRGKLK